MTRFSIEIPLTGLSVTHIKNDGLSVLFFDDDPSSRLDLHGEFWIRVGDFVERYDPREAFVTNVLESLIGVEVHSARASRNGVLVVRFVDGRELQVPDGPYENWHVYTAKGNWHGGIGTVA